MINPIDCTIRFITQFKEKSKCCRTAARRGGGAATLCGAERQLGAKRRDQSCLPGSDERYCSFSATPSHSFASGSGSLRSVMLGQTLA